MEIHHTYPHLYEIDSDAVHQSKASKKFCASIADYADFFMDTYAKDDVMRVEQKADGDHKQYELTRLNSLTNGLNTAL